MTLRVENEMECYEVDNIECKGLYSDRPKIKVISHWNRSEMVILQIEGGKKYTVLAKELNSAISNARNIEEFRREL